MKVREAKELVLNGIYRDLRESGAVVVVDAASPDPSDPGKFTIDGKSARAIHHFDGYYVPINLEWFGGSYDRPAINRGEFYWYVFAIPDFGRYMQPHYFVCDYLQVREWVLQFQAPAGRTHRNHKDWRADIRVDRGLSGETQAYFRWGDEPLSWEYPNRIVRLDNIAVVAHADLLQRHGLHVGATGFGGESEAHRRLKLYVAGHPEMLTLSSAAASEVEHRFVTGDVCDVLYRNHGPLRTVAEIELSGTDNILVGIHQAIKYRSLAASESGIRLDAYSDLAAYVVSYEDGGQRAHDLAGSYNVELLTVDRAAVLAPTD